MKIMKKRIGITIIICIFLSILFSFSMMAYASDEDLPKLSVEKVKSNAGERVEVDVKITGNYGILGATLEITYDSGLKLVDSESGDVMKTLFMTKPGKYESPCKFLWDGQEISSSDIKDGTVLKLYFEVSKDVKPGQIMNVGVSYKNGDIVDGNMKPITVSVSGGSVEVTGVTEKIESFSVLGAKMNSGKLNVTVNNKVKLENLIFMIALYNDNGKMDKSLIQKRTINSGVNNAEFAIDSTGKKCKIFVLNENFAPISSAYCLEKDSRVFTVNFLDWSGDIISKQYVKEGSDAIVPDVSERAGYEFTGWDKNCTNITGNMNITAQYKEVATSSPKITVSNETANSGDNVSVSVELNNNPGILGMTLYIDYDDSQMELIGMTCGEAFDGVLVLTKPGVFTKGCKAVWDGVEISQSDIKDGAILTLNFKIKNDASEGGYPVKISYKSGDIIDNMLLSVNAEVINGSITVK